MKSLYEPPIITGLPLESQGKVRDTFTIPGHPDKLLPVATDRVSSHDVVHKSHIPKKGKALTALTVFWMTGPLKEAGLPTHLIAYGTDIYNYLPKNISYPKDLHERALIIKKLKMIDVEFIYRSYMAGSFWKKYYSKGIPDPYGLNLPPGYKFMSKFPETIFTPTEKSDDDDPMKTAEVLRQYPEASALSKLVFETARTYALAKDINIIDSKSEIGMDECGNCILGDECITPDSCRFVASDDVVEGVEPTWLDKQYLREEAERIWGGGEKVPLTFSDKVIAETTRRYEAITKTITGKPLL